MGILTESARAEIRSLCEARANWDELVDQYQGANTRSERRKIAGEISEKLIKQFKRGFFRDIERANLGFESDVISALGYKLATIIDAYAKKGGNFLALAKTAIRNQLRDEQRTASSLRQTIKKKKGQLHPGKRFGPEGTVMEPKPEKPKMGRAERRAMRAAVSDAIKALEKKKPEVAEFIKELTGWEANPEYSDVMLQMLLKTSPEKTLGPGKLRPGTFKVAPARFKGGKMVSRGGGFKRGELKRALKSIGREGGGSDNVWAQRARKSFAMMICKRALRDPRLRHLFPDGANCKKLAADIETDGDALIEAVGSMCDVATDYLTEDDAVEYIYGLCQYAIVEDLEEFADE